jgi:predicted amidohydrolase YtcJ
MRIAFRTTIRSCRSLFVNGKPIDGTEAIGEAQHPTRAEVLRMYTLNSAWFAHDDDKRGSLEPGKYADLAVLNKDSIESVLTMLGGRVVYAPVCMRP